MVEISTSILSVKKEDIIKKIYELETAGTSYFHIDVMDGEFVGNNTVDLMQVYSEYIKQISNLPLDVHLMVKDVESFIKSYSILEPSIITFHLEACSSKEEVFKLIELIKNNNCRVGISIKPNTSIEEIKEFLPYIHLCLVMTVEPGKGGQTFLSDMVSKIEKIKQYSVENNLEYQIEVDGGINLATCEKVKQAGAEILVAGTAILKAVDYKVIIDELKK